MVVQVMDKSWKFKIIVLVDLESPFFYAPRVILLIIPSSLSEAITALEIRPFLSGFVRNRFYLYSVLYVTDKRGGFHIAVYLDFFEGL